MREVDVLCAWYFAGARFACPLPDLFLPEISLLLEVPRKEALGKEQVRKGAERSVAPAVLSRAFVPLWLRDEHDFPVVLSIGH